VCSGPYVVRYDPRVGRYPSRHVWSIVATAVVGVSLAGVTYFALDRGEDNVVGMQFDRDVDAIRRAIREQFATALETLHAIDQFYLGSDEVERDEFHVFNARALMRHGNIQALAWAPRVRNAERAEHEEEIREGIRESYGIRERTESGALAAAADRKEYVPIVFVEPAAESDGVLGLDLAASPARAAVLAEARDTGRPRAVAMPWPGLELAPLFLLPIYVNGRDVSTTEGRRRWLMGYATAVVDVPGVVQQALEDFEQLDAMRLRIEDGGGVLHEHNPDLAAVADPRQKSIVVAGRRYAISLAPSVDYSSERRTVGPLALGSAILLLTVAVGANFFLLGRRTQRIEGLVEQRTEEIRRVSRLQRAILDSASYSIFSTDPDGVIQTFNPAAERMLGYEAEEVIGVVTPVMFHRADELKARALALGARLGYAVPDGFPALTVLASEGRTDENEWTYVRRDGTEFPVLLSVTVLQDEAGNVTGFLGIADDITARKDAERRLREASAAAEAASRAKSQFLANMSHELRTPLNAVIGYSEMLEEDAVEEGNEQAANDLQRIKAAGRHLLQLINDVLDLSKVEAGRVELCRESVDVRSLVADVATTVRPLVARKENRLDVRIGEDVGSLDTDLTRLRQVLFNLLSNAAKFTEKGTIRLEAFRRDGALFFAVEDTGIGMTPDQLLRVFEPFSQADESTTRKFGGTGLGLAICKEYCKLLGGEIEVHSEPGQGSRFTIRFSAAAPAASAPPVPASARGDTVLVIDDSEEVRELVSRILGREGYRVVAASGGEQGLELARSERPLAILLDVIMPSMDGWSVLSALKADPELADIPVVLQTMTEDRQMGFALGAAEFIVKPVDRERLVSVLDDLRDGGRRVLVVEDEDAVREMVRRSLEKAGWQVDEAANGAVALEMLGDARPDVILLDLMMPDVDGFEVVEAMRRSDAWARIPIVVLTAKDLTRAERERLNGRVARILNKGAYDRARLLDEVRRLVRASTRAEG